MIFTLPQAIDQSATKYPEKDAFRFGTLSITYANLVKQSNQLANLLVQLGIKKGDRIGVFMGRSLETCIAVYGILKAGAVFVPFDPTAPLQRTQFLVDDCDIDILITNAAQKRNLKKVFAERTDLKTIIGIGGEWPLESYSWEEVFENQPMVDPKVNILEHDLAYIMYTSGTTGQPKGIMHTHYSGLSYAKLSMSLYEVNPDDRIGTHSPLHFDISTFGYFTSPLAGATAIIVSDAHTKMPVSLAQLMEKEKLTIWYSVPLALIQVLQKGLIEEKDMTKLRWILYGGEPFPTKHLKRLMSLWPEAQFSNVYGPAEVNQCTYYTIPKDIDENIAVPLGTIWDNTEMLILDEENQASKKGELLIRSATMMQGYWRKEALTNQRFYKLKKSETDSFYRTFYRTGDLVELNEDGLLFFHGRIDRQIKTRGFRVELDEVDTILLEHEGISNAVAFTYKDEQYGTIIAAAIVLHSSEDSIKEQIQLHLKNRLPHYAVPGQLFFIDEIPRTSAGKVNHKILEQHTNTTNQ